MSIVNYADRNKNKEESENPYTLTLIKMILVTIFSCVYCVCICNHSISYILIVGMPLKFFQDTSSIDPTHCFSDMYVHFIDFFLQ